MIIPLPHFGNVLKSEKKMCRSPPPPPPPPNSRPMLKRCREVIEADGGPINYWTLHSLWCLLKVKHRVTCNKWCLKVQKHAWFSCHSCRSWHKSQKCKIFFHTFCHKMHYFTPTMPSIGRHIPFIFWVRKCHIHYRFKISKILFEI